MNHFKNLLEGARQVLVLGCGNPYIRPSINGFARDRAALRGDSKQIGADLSKTIKKYDKQIYSNES